MNFSPTRLLLLCSLFTTTATADVGEAIYTKHCAECHGPKGQGVAGKFDEALFGERSVESLAKYIDKNMPEESPEAVNAEESLEVAKYIHGQFYSPAARAKLFPPTISPSRLTVAQFGESTADLFLGFAEPRGPTPVGGLKATYFISDGMNKKAKKHAEQADSVLAFDFGDREPLPGLPPEQYSIAWQGSLLTEDTGWHEFRLSTPNGARLYLNADLRDGDGNFRDDSNDKRAPAFIDAWVSSGSEVRTATARMFMLGGRAYPMRLDYFKFKDKVGSIKLEWKQPHMPWAVVQTPHLSGELSNHVPVADVSFPADDASSGYERGNAVSKQWHEAVMKSALILATETVGRLPKLMKTKLEAPEAPAKLREFLGKLAERAFRRPLDDAQWQIYVEANFKNNQPLEVAAKQGILRILGSPRFLYPEFAQPEDGWKTATRLALALWDSLPDKELRAAARSGQLNTTEQIQTHAKRMMQDPRAKAKLRGFFTTWLNMEEGEDLSKDNKAYPDFDETVVADLRRSLHHFVDHVVWGESSDYRHLLEADYLFLNERLAKLYGIEGPKSGAFELVKCDPIQRAGILTHPFLLSAFAYHKSSSPIHRGVFLTRHVLGRTLRPPPMAIEFMDDRFDPSLTMREKVTELTSKQSCISCHTIINPLGFSLEHFDAIGRFRTTDNNKPVNAVSEYLDSEGKAVKLHGPRDLAKHAASSQDARRGFVRQLFQYTLKQPPAGYGPAVIDTLEAQFSANNCHIRQLFIDIAVQSTQVPKKSS